jgi:hypothetical protein
MFTGFKNFSVTPSPYCNRHATPEKRVISCWRSAVKIFRPFQRARWSYPLVGLRRPNFGTVLRRHVAAFKARMCLRTPKLFRQSQQSLRALAILAVHKHQRSVMRFGNLTT